MLPEETWEREESVMVGVELLKDVIVADTAALEKLYARSRCTTAYLYEVKETTELSVNEVEEELSEMVRIVQSPIVFGPLIPPVIEY